MATKTVYGYVDGKDRTYISGTGDFTIGQKVKDGVYDITFKTPFSDIPAVTANCQENQTNRGISIHISQIDSGQVQLVAKARQAQLAREIGVQQGAIYDAAKAAQIGRQLGAKYFVTGKLTAVDERLQKTRRLQYSLFVQILELETGLVKFQHETARSKALKN